MTPEEIVAAFATAGGVLPRAALEAALADWDAVAPTLLAGLAAYADGSDRSEPATETLFFAVHLMGQVHERRGHAALCALAGDRDALEPVLGDGITTTLPAILARTFDGDLASLLALIDAEVADEFVRNAALQAWSRVVADSHVPRDVAEAQCRAWFDTLRPREPSMVWVAWQQAISTLGFAGLRDLVREAFAQEWVDASVLEFPDFEQDLAARLAEPDDEAAFGRRHYVDLEDAIGELASWAGFNPAPPRNVLPPPRDGHFSSAGDRWVTEPIHNPLRHVGRNDPCPCGSGKKFKKCCLGKAA